MLNQDKILNISRNAQYWLVRAGNNAEFYEDFQYNNFIAVGNNNILLSDLKDISPYYRINEDILEKQYKDIFFKSFLSSYNNNENNRQKDRLTRQNDLNSLKRSSSIAASKVFNFVEKMAIGDFIIIPDRGSSKFLLGFILSEAFDEEINHITQESVFDEMSEPGYTISNFQKKRRVFWIKEFMQKDLPDKLSWIRQTRQSIYNLTSDADQINPLIAANYIYNDEIYCRIGVTTTKQVNSKELFEFQKLIVDVADKKADKIHQKTNIQSPGFILLHTALDNWKILAIIAASLFSNVTISSGNYSAKISGILPYFMERKFKKAMQNEQLRDAKLKNDLNEIKIKTEKLELQKKELELEKSKHKSEIDIQNLKLTNSEVGNEIPIEMQMDNLSDNLDSLETKITPKEK